MLRTLFFASILLSSIFANTTFLQEPSLKVKLSDKEKQYLKNKTIKFCVEPNWMPYESIDKNGKYDGMGSDYIKLFTKRLGAKFELYPTRNWKETIQSAKERRCDIITMAVENEYRKTFMNFTKPYLSFPIVITTTTDKLFIEDIKFELDKVYSAVEGFAVVKYLRQKYPDIKLLEVKNTFIGLQKVNKAEVFGHIDSALAIGYLINKENLFNLKIAGSLQRYAAQSIAIRKDEPILSSIMNKAVDSLEEYERSAIENKWLSVKFDKGFNYDLVWKVVYICLFILLGVFYWNRKLSKSEKKTQKALGDVLEVEKELNSKILELELLNKKMNEEVQKNKQQEEIILFQSRLATMGETISIIAHQWRQPIAILSSHINNIELEVKYKKEYDPKKLIELIDDSQLTLEHISNTITVFQDYLSPSKNIDSKELDVKTIIDNALNLYAPMVQKSDIEILKNYDKTVLITGNEEYFIQVILILLNNAKDVLIKKNIEKPLISIETKKVYNGLQIDISDNGSGIKEEDLNKIFEPYVSSDISNGKGLGLFIAKNIITKNFNGKMFAHNSIYGATFTIVVPASKA